MQLLAHKPLKKSFLKVKQRRVEVAEDSTDEGPLGHEETKPRLCPDRIRVKKEGELYK